MDLDPGIPIQRIPEGVMKELARHLDIGTEHSWESLAEYMDLDAVAVSVRFHWLNLLCDLSVAFSAFSGMKIAQLSKSRELFLALLQTAASRAYSVGDCVWLCGCCQTSSNCYSGPIVFLLILTILSHTIYVPVCKNCGTDFWNSNSKIFGEFF